MVAEQLLRPGCDWSTFFFPCYLAPAAGNEPLFRHASTAAQIQTDRTVGRRPEWGKLSVMMRSWGVAVMMSWYPNVC